MVEMGKVVVARILSPLDGPQVVLRAAVIFMAGFVVASPFHTVAAAAEKNAPEAREQTRDSEVKTKEGESQPDEDQIAEDCVAFVRSTKVVPARAANADCPECPAGGTDLLSFRSMKIDSVSCSGDTCTVTVTIRAVFNRASGETLVGGLTAWIPPEERSAYLSGQTPSGEQDYLVQITYKRSSGGRWRAVEFDRASTPARSGIEGTIVVSPIRPGPIRKDEVAKVAPARDTTFVVKAGDATVKTFVTDSNGRFQIALPPGHYVIEREGSAARIGRWRFEADVRAGEMSKVTWNADSGMR